MVLVLVVVGMREDDVRVVAGDGGFNDTHHFLAVPEQVRVCEVVKGHSGEAHERRAAPRVEGALQGIPATGAIAHDEPLHLVSGVYELRQGTAAGKFKVVGVGARSE